MQIAKLGSPLKIGTPGQVFPDLAIPETITTEWLAENGAVAVATPQYDADSQVLQELRYPELHNDQLYLHRVREMTAEEYQAYHADKD